ncbi:MAG: sigma-70 family RNA polymerase sigma factor [Planctomycetota bacterium]
MPAREAEREPEREVEREAERTAGPDVDPVVGPAIRPAAGTVDAPATGGRPPTAPGLADAASSDAVPLDAVPFDAVPVDTVPVDAVPVDAVLVDAVPVAVRGPAGFPAFGRRPARASDDDPALTAAVARARRGDPHAFDTIAAILAPPLTRYATVILGGDGAAADDVVQDALVAGWLALPTLRAPHRLRGWMFSVTHRKAMSWLRYRGIRRSDPLIDDADAEDGPRAPAPPPPTSAEEEARADLYRALGSIPVRYVGPLTLCYLEGLGLRETARVLALAPNTLKMRLHRGRALLRRRLTRLEGWRLHRRRDATAGPAPASAPDPTLPPPPQSPEDAPRRSPA